MRRTDRGFAVEEFKDSYGRQCSIQESSAAIEPYIWLGCDELLTDPATGEKSAVRMHLTKGMAARLISQLTTFVETGHL